MNEAVRLRGRRLFAVPACLGTVVAMACSSTPPAIPNVAVATSVTASIDPRYVGECHFNPTILTIGDPANAMSVDNGTGVLTINPCSVIQNGNAYDVNAVINNRGSTDPKSGSITIQGKFAPPDPTMAMPGHALQANVGPITAAFVYGPSSGTFEETDCTAWYTTSLGTPQHGNTNSNMGVAPGRVWATILCPAATFSPPPAMGNQVCQITADIKLQNCDNGTPQ